MNYGTLSPYTDASCNRSNLGFNRKWKQMARARTFSRTVSISCVGGARRQIITPRFSQNWLFTVITVIGVGWNGWNGRFNRSVMFYIIISRHRAELLFPTAFYGDVTFLSSGKRKWSPCVKVCVGILLIVPDVPTFFPLHERGIKIKKEGNKKWERFA